MAIENELKAILVLDNPGEFLKSLKKKSKCETFDITQGYLSKSARIRHIVPHNDVKNEQFVFTYKTKVSSETVELEHQISIHDYHKLCLIVKPIIHKTRIKCKDGVYTWDIDFFKTPKSGNIYFAMAEVEMPEFEFEAPMPLDIISPYIAKWVDPGDKRFGNKNLWNPIKVAKLLKEVLDDKKTKAN